MASALEDDAAVRELYEAIVGGCHGLPLEGCHSCHLREVYEAMTDDHDPERLRLLLEGR